MYCVQQVEFSSKTSPDKWHRYLLIATVDDEGSRAEVAFITGTPPRLELPLFVTMKKGHEGLREALSQARDWLTAQHLRLDKHAYAPVECQWTKGQLLEWAIMAKKLLDKP